MRFSFKKSHAVAPAIASEVSLPSKLTAVNDIVDIETPLVAEGDLEELDKSPEAAAETVLDASAQASISSLGSSEATLTEPPQQSQSSPPVITDICTPPTLSNPTNLSLTLATTATTNDTPTITTSSNNTPTAADPSSPTLNSSPPTSLWVVRPGVGTSGRATSVSPTKQISTLSTVSLGVALAAEGNIVTPRQPPVHVVSTVLPKGSGLGIPSPVSVAASNRASERLVASSQAAETAATSLTPVTKLNHTSEALPSLKSKGRYVVVRPAGASEAAIELSSTNPSTAPRQPQQTSSNSSQINTQCLPPPAISKIDDINRRWNEMMDKTTPATLKSDSPGIFSAPGEISPDPAPGEPEVKKKQRRNISFSEKVMFRTVSIVTLEKPQQNIMVLRPDGTFDTETQDFWSDNDEEDEDEDDDGDEEEEGREEVKRPRTPHDLRRDSDDSTDEGNPSHIYEDSAIDLNALSRDCEGRSNEGGVGKKKTKKTVHSADANVVAGDAVVAEGDWLLPQSQNQTQINQPKFRKGPQVLVSPPGYIKSPTTPRRAFTSRSNSGFVSGRYANLHATEATGADGFASKRKQIRKQLGIQNTSISNCTVDPVTPFQIPAPPPPPPQPSSQIIQPAQQQVTTRRGPSITAPMILRNQSHSAPLHRESLRGDLGDNMAYWTDLEHRHSAGDGMDVTDRTEAARSHRMNSRDVFHESSSNSTVPRPSIMFSRHQQHPHSAPPSASDTVKAAYLRHQVADFAERGRGYDEHMDSRPYEEGYHRHQEAAYENTLGQDDLVPTAKPRVFVVAPLRAPTHDAWTGPSLARDAQPSTSCVEREERPINPVPPPPLPTVKPSGLASQRRASLSRSAPSSAVVDPDTHAPVPVVLIKMSDPDPDPLLPASDAACTRKAKASTSTSLAQNSPASKGSESHQAEDVDISASLKAQQDVVCNPSPPAEKKVPSSIPSTSTLPQLPEIPPKSATTSPPLSAPSTSTTLRLTPKPSLQKMKSRTQTTSSKTLSLKSPDQSPSTSEAQTSSPPPPPIFIQRKSLSLHRKSLSSLYTPKARASNDSLTRTPSVAPDDSLNGSIGTPQSQQLMFPPSSASLVAVGRMLADSYEQANRMTDLRDDVEDPAATLVGTTGVRVSTWSWRSTGPRNSFESSSRATRKSKGWRPPVVEFFSDLGAKIKNLFVGRRRRRI